jgi:hypothetical protein
MKFWFWLKKMRPLKMKWTIQKHVEKVESENVQTENSWVEKNGEQLMKKKLQK